MIKQKHKKSDFKRYHSNEFPRTCSPLAGIYNFIVPYLSKLYAD